MAGIRTSWVGLFGAGLLLALAGCGDDGDRSTTTVGATTMMMTSLGGSTTEPGTSTGPDATTGTTAEPTTAPASTGPGPVCGDGNVDDGEACDDGPDNGDDKACTAACKTGVCGDGLVIAGVEGCDDGNTRDGDGCSATCVGESCGDGIVQATEECDDGNMDDADACLSICAAAKCGDAVVWQSVEECDDGNADDTDACLSTCKSAVCGDMAVQAGVEACDDGNMDDTDACLATCAAAKCGDMVVWAGMEDCDDGNVDETDMCTTKCKAPACDDSLKSGMETDVDCGGMCMTKCAIGKACLVNGDCQSGACKMNVCAPPPKTCKEVLANDPMAKSGAFKVDLDGDPNTAAVDVYCDMTTSGGGWTIVYAATGADNQVAITSNTEALIGNPLMFQHYNVSRNKKVLLGALSTETLVVRNNNTWLKASAAAFNAQLNMANQTFKTAVDLTASNGVMAKGFLGFANFNNQGGGDFGITVSPDGPTCSGTTMTGFDHHGPTYRMLNCGCERHYLYSYSSAVNDGDAGYDSLTALGSWTASNANCGAAAAEGGALVFYLALR